MQRSRTLHAEPRALIAGQGQGHGQRHGRSDPLPQKASERSRPDTVCDVRSRLMRRVYARVEIAHRDHVREVHDAVRLLGLEVKKALAAV